jgi:acetyl-CoA carboxylase/biotin carboxylase 1
MATPEDLEANAEYIRMADKFVQVPGGKNCNNYANVDLIVDVAKRTKVHAVWAGWGHASENPKLPDALTKINVAFIGPPSAPMRSLGDKIASTILAQSAGVPTIPWSGSDVIVDLEDKKLVVINEETIRLACIDDPVQGLEIAKNIGFPVMIKASEGGGGKGIRKVLSESEFNIAFEQVKKEVLGSPIFVMKLASCARHLEVQILADKYGNAISLFGRDCSVQRRHQKIIEEAPVTIAPRETMAAMEQAAVRLAELVGYQSAGTVEYLYNLENDEFYFLELNPRLQVEHPCTEIVSGVNLPAAQLQIAMGIPLHFIKDIRNLYGVDPNGNSLIDFSFQNEDSFKVQKIPSPRGHVIATRITAENPEAGFKPNSGTLMELNFKSSSDVWGYFSVGVSGGLHEFADSQFGHLFAYGDNREQARRNIVMALKELFIRGDFRTTVEYLKQLLETTEFMTNDFNTDWLDVLISKNVEVEKPDELVAVICATVNRVVEQKKERRNCFMKMLERGQIPPKELLKSTFKVEIFYQNFKYDFSVSLGGPDIIHLVINGSVITVIYRELSDGGILVVFDGKSHTFYSKEEPQNTRLVIDGKTCSIGKELDPSHLRSPSPGKLVRFLVQDGAHLQKDDIYAEVEVMKMYLPLIVKDPGTIRLIKQPGSIIENGDLIAIISLDDPSKIKTALPFQKPIRMGPPFFAGDSPFQIFQGAKEKIDLILDGYEVFGIHREMVNAMSHAAEDPLLFRSEFHSVLSNFTGRLSPVEDKLFDSQISIHDIEKALEKLDSDFVKPLSAVLEKHKTNLKALVFNEFLEKYYTTEIVFDNDSEDVLLKLREKLKIEDLIRLVISHSNFVVKNSLILDIMKFIQEDWSDLYCPTLRKIASLNNEHLSQVALKAREVLLLANTRERRQIVDSTLQSCSDGFNLEILRPLIEINYSISDALFPHFFSSNRNISNAAMEVYNRRRYYNDISDITFGDREIKWIFDGNVGQMFIMNDLNGFENLKIRCRVAIIAIKMEEEDSEIINKLNILMSEHSDLKSRITFLVVKKNSFSYFTFQNGVEDISLRYVDPAMADHFELNRLENFDIKEVVTDNRQLQIFFATAKENKADRRIFIRAAV